LSSADLDYYPLKRNFTVTATEPTEYKIRLTANLMSNKNIKVDSRNITFMIYVTEKIIKKENLNQNNNETI